MYESVPHRKAPFLSHRKVEPGFQFAMNDGCDQ